MQDNDIEHASTGHPIPISRDFAAARAAVLPGQRLAERYVVGERIGGGGMADVYRGRDLWLCRDVAIKVLKPDMASADLCARMLQEGRAAAAIDHPNLLRVLDIGRLGSTVYLITDLLHGSSLGELLRMVPDGRLDWRRAVELLLPALDALQKVHDHGYIHRDLKPDNLFLHRRDGREVLIVLDLGIAKIAPALRPEGAPCPTETGRVLGTPAYMSPEQASSLPLDHRTDVYSIAVTLHRMLAGRLPFDARPGDTPFALMARHIYDAPPHLNDTHEDIPEALADVVLRSLAKAPAKRPQSMQELAAELRASLPPPVVPIVAVTGKFERSASVHRVGRLSGGVVVFVGLIAMRGPTREAAATTPAAGSLSLEEPGFVAPPLLLPVVRPDRPPAPASAAPAPEPASATPPPRSAAALARVLDGAAGPVTRCMREHGGLELRAIRVRLHLRADGTVARWRLHDADDTTLTGCVRPLLAGLRFPAGPAQRVEHSFTRSLSSRSP